VNIGLLIARKNSRGMSL